MNKPSKAPVRDILREYPSPPVDRQRMKETIEGAAFIVRQAQESRGISFRQFYFIQLRFISKKVWGLQLLIVLGIGMLVHNALQAGRWSGDVQLLMLASIAAPLLALVGVQTMTRSLSCKMLEIELSTKYSLEKLTMVRMSLLGMADIVCLVLLAAFFSVELQQEISFMLLYLLVPFNLTCLGCLVLLNRVRTINCGYSCLIYGGFLVLVQVILAFTPSLQLYKNSTAGVWLILLLLTTAGIAAEVRKLRATCKSIELVSRPVF